MDLAFGCGALGSLPKIRNCRVRRASSYDRSGGNADCGAWQGEEEGQPPLWRS